MPEALPAVAAAAPLQSRLNQCVHAKLQPLQRVAERVAVELPLVLTGWSDAVDAMAEVQV